MTREKGLGLSLSGGGYRAMIYHIGAIIRLQELGLLEKVSRVSSVSGGSITAGVLGLNWTKIGDRKSLFDHFVEPLCTLADQTIDQSSVIKGLLLPGNVGNYISGRYDDILFNGATLQDLPEAPRFVFNATNLETGTLWRFSKPYMRDYRVGQIDRPMVALADAVAASSAFPPVLSPFKLDADAGDFSIRDPNMADGFFDDITLTDGGVYDNYGLEQIWDRYTDVLVSDGGGVLEDDPRPSAEWALQAYRVISILQQQIHALRSRQVIDAFERKEALGCLWSIQTPLSKYSAGSASPVSDATVKRLASTPTRLKRMSRELQQQLINLGYLGCDASIRSWYIPDAPEPAGLPFPKTGF